MDPEARPVRRRRPFRDNPRSILAGIVLLLFVLGGLLWLARGTVELAPDFLSGFVLYALSAADLTMLAVLAFMLARNIVKLLVERRQARPFARFRAKLVAALLGMTIVPALLVLVVGSELILSSVDRWFNAPVDEVLTSARDIASDYYYERQRATQDAAERLVRTLSRAGDRSPDGMRGWLATELSPDRRQRLEVYRLRDGQVGSRPLVMVASDAMPVDGDDAPGTAVPIALVQAALAGEVTATRETLAAGGDVIRSAAVVGPDDGAEPTLLVVASEFLEGDAVIQAQQITRAYEDYNQARVLQRPLAGVYLSFFLMVTLLVLVSATWMGTYLAKRITQPVQKLATAARAIEAGQLDYRVEQEAARRDEFAGLIEAFNSMAGELARNRQRLEQFTTDLERRHTEGEARRRYIELIMERVATGVVSVDAEGRISTVNSAAARLLDFGQDVIGRPVEQAFGRADLRPILGILDGASRDPREPFAQDVTLQRGGREMHLAGVATALQGEAGQPDGHVLVLDDVTPLIRAQKVAAWREVARRLAHEIKNPLTPIRLCAERLERHFSSAPDRTRELVDECTGTIVAEVESLKALVDEFSQFARMPAPRPAPHDLHRLLDETLALYDGLFGAVRIERQYGEGVPAVNIDGEQIKQVIVNLVDNAVEAMDKAGHIVVRTEATSQGVVRVEVADDGPGLPPDDRDKLFLPYYSTKGRGSGLGLAIVRRIVADHGGQVHVTDNEPHGTRFVVDLPSVEAAVGQSA